MGGAEEKKGPTRRGFVKRGILGGALLAIAGAVPVGLWPTRRGAAPRRALKLFSPDEYAIFAAIAARVVPGDGAGPAWPSAEAVDCAGKADNLMALAHPDVGNELRQLLRLFENGLTGFFSTLSPKPFTRCEPAQQDARLVAWRQSRVAVLRTGYQAIVRLAHATYFSSPEVYAAVGYPGPPAVPTMPAPAGGAGGPG